MDGGPNPMRVSVGYFIALLVLNLMLNNMGLGSSILGLGGLKSKSNHDPIDLNSIKLIKN